MPDLIPPAIAAGTVSGRAQPVIAVDEGAVLRPWEAHDAKAVVEAYADPAIQQWHARRVDSIEEATAMIDGWRRGWLAEDHVHWAIADPSTDELLGRIALKQLDFSDGRAALAYWLAPRARGRGLCTRAVVALTRWAFDVGFHRVDLEHAVENLASCRVADRAGFTAEGVRRGAARHEDGWHDMHVHARLVSDG